MSDPDVVEPVYRPYRIGDLVWDVTTDPPPAGVITEVMASRADTYHVNIVDGVNDVIIHARNLRPRDPIDLEIPPEDNPTPPEVPDGGE